MPHSVLNRYGLSHPPFTREVALDDLLELPRAQEDGERLKAALEGKASAVITGDSGTGKTFLWRKVESQLSSGRFHTHYIHNAGVNRRDFYRQLSGGLGLEPKANAAALFRQVQEHVETLASEHRIHPVLALDEAHLLPVTVLEHLHLLLNYQRDSRSFLSLVLLGLPELRERLGRNIMASLSARLPVRVQTTPLEVAEVEEYLRHHMRIAGASQDVFSQEAVLCIREATSGVLRRINTLASACLEVASDGRGTLVDGRTVQQAARRCAEALK